MSRGQILPPDVPIPENHGDHAAAAAQDQNAQADVVPGPGPDAQQSAQARQEVAEAVPFPHDRIFPVVGRNVGDGFRGDLLPGPEIHRRFAAEGPQADAVKQQRILEAEGEAQAILAVQKANADAIRLLNEAMPNDKVLALRSLEALAKVANGKATKIIIPSELQNLGGVVPSIKELLTDPKED